MKKLIDKTTFKFILVGIINTLVGTAVMFLCYNVAHIGYWVSSAANYVVGSVVSYFLNKYYTFQYKKRSASVIVKFILNITVCYLLAYGMAKPLTMWVLDGFEKNIQENIAMLVGMCFFVGLNYIGQKFLVFIDSKEKAENDSSAEK